jgi:hypothetical protein
MKQMVLEYRNMMINLYTLVRIEDGIKMGLEFNLITKIKNFFWVIFFIKYFKK